MNITVHSIAFLIAVLLAFLAALVGWEVISATNGFFRWQGLFAASFFCYLLSYSSAYLPAARRRD